MSFVGLWHITEMENWSASYFNMAGQAFVRIEPSELGSFQFGLVSGQLDGEIKQVGRHERFVFTWDGSDEMDRVSGRGWLELKSQDTLEGELSIHYGDSSMLWAKRVE